MGRSALHHMLQMLHNVASPRYILYTHLASQEEGLGCLHIECSCSEGKSADLSACTAIVCGGRGDEGGGGKLITTTVIEMQKKRVFQISTTEEGSRVGRNVW